jgi:hypothetical protein
MLVIIMILPESPRWLAAHGRADESLSVLRRLNRHKTAEDDILLTHAQIMNTVAYEASIGAGKWKDLLKNDEIQSQRRFLIACSVQAFQQLGGINVSKSRIQSLSSIMLTILPLGTNILFQYPVSVEQFSCSFDITIKLIFTRFSQSLNFSPNLSALMSGFLNTWFVSIFGRLKTPCVNG